MACLKNAQAEESINTLLQESSCGDPAKGKFICDNDSIAYSYDMNSIGRNSWYNWNAINSESPAVFGPGLTFPSISGNGQIVVSATATILENFMIGLNPNDCSNYGKQHEHLFDIILAGDCNGQKDFVLQRASVFVEGAGWSPSQGGCMAGTNYNGRPQLGFAISTSLYTCSNFQFELRQMNPRMKSISDPAMSGIGGGGFPGFHPKNVQILRSH